MERVLYKSLLNWKKSPERKPLMLYGARQVGKTYLFHLYENKGARLCVLAATACHHDEFAAFADSLPHYLLGYPTQSFMPETHADVIGLVETSEHDDFGTYRSPGITFYSNLYRWKY